ncbi:complex I subunit 5 family protein [Candidatus Bipolaricaulota sp. J31]
MTFALIGVAGYLVLGIVGFLVPRARLLSALALAVGVASFLGWLPGFPPGYLGLGDWAITWQGDLLAVAFWGLSLFLHGVLLLSPGRWPNHYYALLTLLVGTVLSLVLSQDLFNLYVCLELTSLIAFLLVGIEGRPAQVWASLKYLILTSCGMILYLLGVGFVYAETGTLSLPALASAERGLPLSLGVGLLLAGAAAKGGVFLYGLWLPVAHGYAPAPVSALLSGLVVKMGVVAAARIAVPFGAELVLVALGLVTGALGILHALFEDRLKVLLAYSTMSQLGYILLGFGWGAWEGAIAYAVAHGLFKALLFLSAGRAEAEGGSHRISLLTGRLSFATRFGLGLGALAIAGLPPLVGYAAKGIISAAAPPWGKWALVVLSLGTAAAFSKFVPLVTRGPKGERLSPDLALLGLAVVGTGVGLCVCKGGLLSPGLLFPGLGALSGGYLIYRLTQKISLRLPRWRLDEAFLALLLAGCVLLLWVLLR